MNKISTPWGPADQAKYLNAEKTLIKVSTSGHGGIGVKLELPMPEYLASVAIKGSEWLWFEEDLNWACAALAFPLCFDAESLTGAENTVLNWFPQIYAQHFGRKPTAKESYKVREQELDAKLHGNYRPRTGYGDWAWNVPIGQCYIEGHRASDNTTQGFLVPKDEYKNYSELVLDNYPHFTPDTSLPHFKPSTAHA